MSLTAVPTLYPKITQHVIEAVKALRRLGPDFAYSQEDLQPISIPLVGSVKLRGTHSDILVYHNDRIVLQSMDVPCITAANDNQGFAAAMADNTAAILDLRDRYRVRWMHLNPDAHLEAALPILIAGEWIGAGIQKDVAVSQLSRRFVIISININNTWVQDAHYEDIEVPTSSIYNISRGGTYTATLHPVDIARTIAEVEPLAEAVALSCPFAASFGVKGEGEGIVWKPEPTHLHLDPALWFKTKGGRFKPTFAPAPKALPVDLQGKRDAADAVAKIWCTPERLQQGWDYLEEVGATRTLKGVGMYLKWVQKDVLIEERGYIDDHGINEGMLRIEIAKMAKQWYITRVGQ